MSEHFSCALNSVLLVPCLLKVKAERLRSNIFPYDHCVKLHKLRAIKYFLDVNGRTDYSYWSEQNIVVSVCVQHLSCVSEKP